MSIQTHDFFFIDIEIYPQNIIRYPSYLDFCRMHCSAEEIRCVFDDI